MGVNGFEQTTGGGTTPSNSFCNSHSDDARLVLVVSGSAASRIHRLSLVTLMTVWSMPKAKNPG